MPSLVNGLYEFGEFLLDAQKRVLRRGSEPVSLTPKAFETLLVLVESHGQVVSKNDLMQAVWPDSFVEESNLTQTIFVLRKALSETSEQRYIVTVPGRGYRFVADVKQAARTTQAETEPLTPAPPASVVRPAAAPPARRSWLLLVSAAVVLVAALTAYYQWGRPHARKQPAGARLMLAVLPFANLTGDASQDYFSDGMTEELITELGRLDPSRVGVIARTSVMLYKAKSTSIDQIGRELGVQYVVEGSVRRDRDRVRITAQLIQVKDQTHLWARQFDRESKDVLVLESEIARGISDEIQHSLGDTQPTPPVTRPTLSPQDDEAHDLYLKGRYFWNKRTEAGFQEAIRYFQQAIAKDPNYARAYAGLADAYGLMSSWSQAPQNEFMPKARAAALKALELDATLAEAHTSLGLIAEAYDYDWDTAEKEFRRAIQLNPDYATAHQWYAEFLSWQGRFEEALAESELARQLDPLSLIIASDHGAIYYYARQYDRAIAQFRAVFEMDPNFPRAQGLMSIAYVQEGRFPEALDIQQRQPVDSASTWAGTAYLYSRWGRAADANGAREKFEELARKLGSNQTWTRVIAYVGTEKNDNIVVMLQKAVAEHSFNPAGIKVDPIYDPLRSDPRFQELLRHLRLAQ